MCCVRPQSEGSASWRYLWEVKKIPECRQILGTSLARSYFENEVIDWSLILLTCHGSKIAIKSDIKLVIELREKAMR
jgi:hypothetical protein